MPPGLLEGPVIQVEPKGEVDPKTSEEKCVSNINTTSVLGLTAATVSTSVSAVGGQDPKFTVKNLVASLPLPSQPPRQFRPALNLGYWSANLPLVYSPSESARILTFLTEGVPIGRSPPDAQLISHNWPSSLEHREQVTSIIDSDLSLGRLLGPFEFPPFDHFVVSPLGAFLKRNSTKVRLIHDLSYPNIGSVNSLIDPKQFTLSYSSVDDATFHCRRLAPGPIFMAKLDLKDAYKHVFIAPSDWPLMGLSWPDSHGRTRFYFSKVLNFGLRSAPFLFDVFAQALYKFMIHSGVTESLVRYVDDFLVVSDSAESCQRYLDIMLAVCNSSGFTVQPAKVTTPSPVVEFLGIIIDSTLGQLRISEDRLEDIRSVISGWVDSRSVQKRRLMSIIGKCSFASRVVRNGRAFLGRLYRAVGSEVPLHHSIRLDSETRADLDWWVRCIRSHNGLSYFNPSWENPIHIYSDASNFGAGALCGPDWFAIVYSGSFADFTSHSINWREFHAALSALVTWGPLFPSRSIIFHIDNTCVCHILNNSYSSVKELMWFVRHWYLTVELYNLTVAPVYISSKDNIDADDLSRGRIDEFRARNPQASPSMTWPNQAFMSTPN